MYLFRFSVTRTRIEIVARYERRARSLTYMYKCMSQDNLRENCLPSDL